MRTEKGYRLTDQQNKIIDTAISGEPVVVNAKAGASKSTTSKIFCKEYKGRVLYTVFGNGNTKDFIKDVAGLNNVMVKSNFGLAFNGIGTKNAYGKIYMDAGRLQETQFILKAIETELKGRIKNHEVGGYFIDKKTIIYDIFRMITRYCYSTDTTISIKHGISDFIYPDETLDVKERLEEAYYSYLLPRAKYIWGRMTNFNNSEFPVSHDVYMKLYHLSSPVLRFDHIIDDEAQDQNPVFVDIINKQNCPKLVLGDDLQSIFSWKGSINALDSFGINHVLPLSKSFRFGEPIAWLAKDVIKHQLGKDTDIEGFERIHTQIHEEDRQFDKFTVLCRTNSECVANLIRYKDIRKVKIVGDMAGTIKYINGIVALRAKKSKQDVKVYGPLSVFKSYGELYDYAKTPAGAEINTLINVMNKCQKEGINAKGLCDILKKSAKTRNPEVIISTAHKSKGAEYDNVILGNDFRTPDDKGWGEEDANLLYVALTRAKKNLQISKCNAILEAIN